MTGRPRSSFLGAASVLFFISGASGLGYQVIWFKRFSHVWGNSSLAMAAVVTSFLSGLGLGAYVLGRAADRVRSPLLVYGLLEVAIGLVAFLVPLEVEVLLGFSTAVYGAVSSSPVWLYLARFLFTLAVLGPPCLLMGGTLPCLVREFTPPGQVPLGSTSWLYALNTLGAALGCALLGFWLLPSLGLGASQTLLALVNVAVGAAAIVLGRSASWRTAPVEPVASEHAVPASPPGQPAHSAVLTAAALAGCAALILEMVWARQLGVILGGSTYVFTAVLTVFLAGVGLGSLVLKLGLSRVRRPDQAAVLIAVGIVAAALAGKLLIPALSFAVGLLRPLRVSPAGNALVSLAASAALELLPALGMGLLFPLLVRLTRESAVRPGAAVGRVYALNTLGSIAGSALTAVLLVDWLGTSGAVAVALGLYTAVAVLLHPPAGSLRPALQLGALVAVASLCVYASSRREDPRSTDRGMYLYGPPDPASLRDEVLFFREGASANVLVLGSGEDRTLRVNGKVDASSRADMDMQLGAAYLPLFLRPQARQVLVIGYGSGTTAGAALLFPEVHVTCCEIESAVVEGAEHFRDVNHDPRRSPRFGIVYDDGRSYLQGSERSFDLMVSEPSNPWIAGVANLFSMEFYELASRRLTAGGLFAQWVQTYSFTAADYALVARTLMQVFEHVYLVRISEGDTLLLAAHAALSPQPADLDAAQGLVDSLPELRKDLERHFQDLDVRSLLFTRVLLDAEGLRRFCQAEGGESVRGELVHSDLNLRLEFDAARSMFVQTAVEKTVLDRVLDGAEVDWYERFGAQLGLGPRHGGAFHKLAVLFDDEAQRELILRIVDLGLRTAPGDPQLLADRLIFAAKGDLDDAAFDAAVAALVAASELEANRVAVAYFGAKDYARAEKVLERLVAAHPESSTSWANLAMTRKEFGRHEAAEEAVRKALALDPFNDFARKADEAVRGRGR
jgi:spermidine synthase